MTEDNDQDTLKKVSESAKTSIGFQAIFKIVSFMFNTIILRFVDFNLYGIANVRLNLLYTTIIFLSREPFRKVCVDLKNVPYYQINNLIWLCVPIGAILSAVLCFIWIYFLDIPELPNYSTYVLLYALSAIIELLSEPIYIFFQSHLYLKPKIFIESSALFIKQCILFLFVYYYPQLKILSFVYSQLIYTSLFLICYVCYFIYYKHTDADFPMKSLQNLNFKYYKEEPIFSSTHIPLIIVFFKQSFIKQLLTESEKYAMTFLHLLNFEDQGLYEVINNIGSLVTRLLFLPLEDAFFLYFSKEYSETKRVTLTSNKVMIPFILLKFLFYIGLTISVFGYWYSPLLLYIFGGMNLATNEAFILMRGCCIYVSLLGLNGISEAFFMATGKKDQIIFFNYLLVLLSILFIILSYFFTSKYHALGFIIANSVTMLIRIIHHIYYLFKLTISFDVPYQEFIEPILIITGGYMIAYLALKLSYFSHSTLQIYDILCHVGIGIFVLICCICVILFVDKDFFGQITYIMGIRRIKGVDEDKQENKKDNLKQQTNKEKQE